jgi:CBS domain-containing protein
MKTIRQILADKSPELCSVSPALAVLDALKLMERMNVGSVLVLDGARVVGIFTERDFARKAIRHTRALADTPVGEMMTVEVRYVTPAQTAEECMALMTEKRVRHLPVLDDGTLLGVVSIGDLVKATIADQQFIIDQLERYITGREYVPG